jgi:hypothetical protein
MGVDISRATKGVTKAIMVSKATVVCKVIVPKVECKVIVVINSMMKDVTDRYGCTHKVFLIYANV